MDTTRRWVVELPDDDQSGSSITRWLDGLDEMRYVAVRATITNQLEVRGIDLCATHWMRPLGEGLYELRIRHDRIEVSPGRWQRAQILLRIFVTFRPGRVCLLLSGYDKARDPSRRRQQAEIQKARQIQRRLQSLN